MHRLPQIDGGNLSLAQGEVQSAGAPQRRSVSDQEVDETLNAALRRIRPAATQICHEMRVGVCTWQFRVSANRSLNASAGANGLIVINRGIVEYAANEEEVAMVIAHEIGHQAADHVATGQRNQAVGSVVGAILLGALGPPRRTQAASTSPIRPRRQAPVSAARSAASRIPRSRSARPTTSQP
ncbi:MAG TPA: M48 family metalloprotease [Reyranella sp.]|nr:M48 family metalloprotease [Reyranella sp.]